LRIGNDGAHGENGHRGRTFILALGGEAEAQAQVDDSSRSPSIADSRESSASGSEAAHARTADAETFFVPRTQRRLV
jgi:hypothetical protein